jgi:hypothetical protein
MLYFGLLCILLHFLKLFEEDSVDAENHAFFDDECDFSVIDFIFLVVCFVVFDSRIAEFFGSF